MPSWNEDYSRQAAEHWAKGESLEAGGLIFENLPPKARPKWAARILKLVLDNSGIQSTLFSPVLIAADDQDRWKTGHDVFDALRTTTLELEKLNRGAGLTKDEEMLQWAVALAELVAKVTYNATNPPDEFDEDSGWWIAQCLKWFVDNGLGDEDFATTAWLTLCSCE